MKPLESTIYDPMSDAAPAIRGYFYQMLVTAVVWLELQDGEQVGIEFGEDIAKIGKSLSAETTQVKHSAAKISLTSISIQKFIANSFRIWGVSGEASKHHFLTTSSIRREADRKKPWISLLGATVSKDLVGYIKNKRVKLGGEELLLWKRMVRTPNDKLAAFLESLRIEPDRPDYLEMIPVAIEKLCKRYADQEPNRLLEKIIFELFTLASQKGVKLLSSNDLDKVAQRTANEDMRISRKLYRMLGLSIVGQMNDELENNRPEFVIAISRAMEQSTPNELLGHEYYTVLGRAHERLDNLHEASANYRRASSLAQQAVSRKYLTGRALLCEDKVGNAKKVGAIAIDIIKNHKGRREGYRLQIMIGVDSISAFAENLPANLKRDPDIVLLIATNFFEAGQVENAIEWANISKRTKEPTIDRACLIFYEMAMYGFHVYENPYPSLQILKALTQHKQDLEEVWRGLEGKEIAGHMTAILNLLATIEFILRDEAYVATIDRAIAFSVDPSDSMHAKAEFMMAKGQARESLDLLIKIDDKTARLQEFLLHLTGIADNVTTLEALEGQVLDLLADLSREPKLANTLVRSFLGFVFIDHPNEFNRVKDLEALQAYIDEGFKRLIEALKTRDKSIRRERVLCNIQELRLSDPSGLLASPIIFKYLHDVEEYDLLLELLEPSKSEYCFQEVDREIVRIAKKSSEKQSRQYDRITGYLNKFGDIPELLEEQLELEIEINSKSSQIEIIDRMLEQRPNNLHLLIIRAQLLARQGQQINANELLNKYSPREHSANLTHGLAIARLLLHSNMHYAAIDLLYEVWKRSPRDEQICSEYFKNTIMTCSGVSAPKEWSDNSTVKDQYVATVKPRSGNTEQYILEAKTEKKDLGSRDINEDDDIYKKLLGKAVGNVVRGLGEIVNIQHKHIALMNKLLVDSDLYLKNTIIAKSESETTKQSIKRLANIIKKQGGALEEALEEAKRTYVNTANLPLSYLARATGKSIITVFYYALETELVPIRCALGNHEERQGLELVVTNIRQAGSTDVALDISVIMTLNELGLLDGIRSVFDGDIFIADSTIDLLRSQIEEFRIYTQRAGAMATASVVGGKLSIQEPPPEFYGKKLSQLEDLQEWLRENTITKSSVGVLSMNATEREFYSDALGRHAVDTMHLAVDGVLFASDEVLLRHLASEYVDAPGIWSQPIIQIMHERDAITTDQYHKSIGQLVKCGYTYISVSAESLIYETMQAPSRVGNLDGFLDVINSSSPRSIIQVVSDYLIKLHGEGLVGVSKVSITKYVLDRVAKSHSQEWVTSLSKAVMQKLYLQPILVNNILSTLSVWQQTR